MVGFDDDCLIFTGKYLREPNPSTGKFPRGQIAPPRPHGLAQNSTLRGVPANNSNFSNNYARTSSKLEVVRGAHCISQCVFPIAL
eukprot:COSAG02_NODE_36416_length_454_cov_14.098592_1_plen_85_part_00